MENKKIKYIEILIKKRDEVFMGGHYNLIIHSILNTYDLEELIDYYLPLSDSKEKRSIESNIFKRIVLLENADYFYEWLYNRLYKADYNQRQRIRKLLMLILPSLDYTYRRKFFNTFYYSKYSNDISSALSVCSEIWDNDLNTMILNDYIKTKKDIYLKTFLQHGEVESLLPHFLKIWSFDPGNYLKLEMVRKLSKKHFDNFEFLRKLEPDKYLLAVSLSDKEFENESLIDCLNELPDDIKPFGILNLSRLGKWELIESEIKKYVS